ncbi:hypothetical protein B9Z45_12310 [Limnohabitans sp. 2KL-17]|uniref:porin n=1 Tax=Limnohabitans sp. 2KL-17 TaxID=1100704 RepID=UPI000D3BD6DE|nr:porin [Limnohabitans sp. 2KL-17]PUE53617.1 hypothetical protein B9Z45_12310 [Limnohabitans sp. 2KL-17]
MKKTLIALATLAAATGALAQSTVTLFGVADAAVQYTKTGAAKKTAMATSALNSSRFGVRGEEDLGGGMKAGFHLEAGVANDSGAGAATNTNNQTVTALTSAGTQGLTFNRRSTLSLMGGFGELRVGRDYTPLFWTQTIYDPFGTNGVGASQANASANPATLLTGVRASNSIGYISPSFSGFAVQVQTYLGENASNDALGKKTGSGNGLRATYEQGPVSVALATAKYDTALNTTHKGTNVGASYDLGMVKLTGLYSTDEDTGAAKVKGYLVGLTAPLGAGVAKLAFSNAKQGTTLDTDKFAAGYVYSLSKRTSIYTTIANTKPKTGDKTTGFDLGVSHSF